MFVCVQLNFFSFFPLSIFVDSCCCRWCWCFHSTKSATTTGAMAHHLPPIRLIIIYMAPAREQTSTRPFNLNNHSFIALNSKKTWAPASSEAKMVGKKGQKSQKWKRGWKVKNWRRRREVNGREKKRKSKQQEKKQMKRKRKKKRTTRQAHTHTHTLDSSWMKKKKKSAFFL